MTLKRIIFLVFICLLAAGVWGAVVTLPQITKNHVEAMLREAGFRQASVESVRISPTAFSARNITLNNDEFDRMESLNARLSWLEFFLQGKKIHSVTIKNLMLSEEMNSLSGLPFPERWLDPEAIRALPFGQLEIEGAKIDLATPHGDLRLEVKLLIRDAKDGSGNKDIQALVWAQQYQLAFVTQWTGTANPGKLSLDADIQDGRLHFDPVHVGRAAGWVSLVIADGMAQLSGQVDAGSGAFFGVPARNISLVLSNGDNKAHAFLRAQAAGTENARLAADWTMTEGQSDFSMSADIPHIQEFLESVRAFRKSDKRAPEVLTEIQKPVYLSAVYLNERRFAGGPFPFDLDAGVRESKQTPNEKRSFLHGTFLIYPDTLDIRGSAEVQDEDMAKALQQFLSIPDEKISGTVLRLDGNLRPLSNMPENAK